MRRYNFRVIIFGYIFANSQFASLASADTELSKMRDCTEIELEALIDQDVSREENLARLTQQFFESVNKIDYCDRKLINDDTVESSLDNYNKSANAGLKKQQPAMMNPARLPAKKLIMPTIRNK